MNKKIIVAFPVLLILVSSCLCRLDTRKLLLGCYWQDCVPERNFHVLDWKIPAEMFSEGALVSDMMIPSEGAGEIESGDQNIFWDNGNGSAIYIINRYRTVKAAVEEYQSRLKLLADDETKTPWTSPSNTTFSSSTADEFLIACGNWIFGKRCGMTARYNEYVILFHATIDDKMSYSDFEKIVVYIDSQLSNRLYP